MTMSCVGVVYITQHVEKKCLQMLVSFLRERENW